MKKFVMVFCDENPNEQTILLINSENEKKAIDAGFNQMGFDLSSDVDNSYIADQMEINDVLIQEIPENTNDDIIKMSGFDIVAI